MHTTHLSGRWTRGQALLRWTESTYQSTPETDAQMEAEWRKVKARLGDRIFDGPMCRMERMAVEDTGRLRLELSRTSYRIFVGTNMSHPEWADTIGPQVMANTVGVSTTLITANGFVMLGRRSDNVAYYPYMLHPFSGSLEPRQASVEREAPAKPSCDRRELPDGSAGASPSTPPPSAAGCPDLFDEALRELHEELGLTPGDITEIACIGIIEDMQLRHPETILYARTVKTRSQIEQSLLGNEHTAAWNCRATRAAIHEALADRSHFTPVAQGSLQLLAGHLPG